MREERTVPRHTRRAVKTYKYAFGFVFVSRVLTAADDHKMRMAELAELVGRKDGRIFSWWAIVGTKQLGCVGQLVAQYYITS